MTEEQQKEPDAPDIATPFAPQSFLDFLAYQQNGVLVKELSEQLREITEALKLHQAEFHGRPTGELKIRIALALDDDNLVRVKVMHETSRPKVPATSTIMFLGSTGDLMGHNPKQLSMFR